MAPTPTVQLNIHIESSSNHNKNKIKILHILSVTQLTLQSLISFHLFVIPLYQHLYHNLYPHPHHHNHHHPHNHTHQHTNSHPHQHLKHFHFLILRVLSLICLIYNVCSTHFEIQNHCFICCSWTNEFRYSVKWWCRKFSSNSRGCEIMTYALSSVVFSH